MAAVLTVLKRTKLGASLDALVQVTLSGSYPALGEPIDWDAAVGFTNRSPSFVVIVGNAGFVYQWDFANQKLRVRVNDAGGANAPMGEHTTAAYAGGVSADTIIASIFWRTTPGLPV